MTRDQIIAMVAGRLGQRTDLNASILTELDFVQSLSLERNGRILPWFLQSVDSSLVTVAGIQTVALPTGHIGDDDEGGLFLQDADGKWSPLKKVDISDILTSEEESGTPERYALRGLSYYLDPVPDAIYSMRTAFYAADTLPGAFSSGTQTNNWLTYAPDLVVAELTRVMAEGYTRDYDVVQAMLTPGGVLQKAWDRLNVETEARKHTDRSYQMGDL